MGRQQQQREQSDDDEPQHGQHAGEERRQTHKPALFEWVIAGISAALVLATIGFTLYQAISAKTTKPELDVAVERTEAVRGGYRVEFRATNRGDSTAAAVTIEGQLKRGDRTIETSEVTLDYVPAHSHSGGGLLFEHDPSEYRLQLNAKGYQNP